MYINSNNNSNNNNSCFKDEEGRGGVKGWERGSGRDGIGRTKGGDKRLVTVVCQAVAFSLQATLCC